MSNILESSYGAVLRPVNVDTLPMQVWICVSADSIRSIKELATGNTMLFDCMLCKSKHWFSPIFYNKYSFAFQRVRTVHSKETEYDKVNTNTLLHHDRWILALIKKTMQKHYLPMTHFLQNKTLKLFAGISILVSNSNPLALATSITASKSRIPHVGSRDFKEASNFLYIDDTIGWWD